MPLRMPTMRIKLCVVQSFASCLQVCTDVRSLKKLHARIVTLGLGSVEFLGSKILHCYAEFGFLGESKLVFRKIVDKDLPFWNSAIVGCFRAGYAAEVLALYRRMKRRQIGLDGRPITFGLKSCAELRELSLGKGMHADSVKLGLCEGKFVGSSLVGLYSKHGEIHDAQRAFEEIFDKDMVAYTAMVTAYSQNVGSTVWKAFEIAADMLRNGLEVNRVTLVSLLRAAGNLRALREGRSVHCYSIRRGVGVLDEVLQTSIVDMYTRCGAMDLAAAFLKGSTGNLASWNAMLGGLAHFGERRKAIECFAVMLQEHKLLPDSITIANLLSACAELPFAGYAACIHAFLIRRLIPLDVVLATTLIEVYSVCDRVGRSRQLFDQLWIKDVVSYNVMICGYLQNCMADQAIKLLNQMTAEDVAPDAVTVLNILADFADQRDLIRGMGIHGFVIRRGFLSDVDIANQFLHMYSTCGCMEAARSVFNSLTQRNLVSWTAMMMGCLSCGHAEEAVRLYQRMQQQGEEPDSVTLITAVQAVAELGYLKIVKEIHGFICRVLLERDRTAANSLMTAYAKCGRLDSSLGLFVSLEERGLDSWNTMIAAYGMHGCSIKVLELFKLMQEANIRPDELTFSSVLSACSHAGLVEEGFEVFQSMSTVYSIPPGEVHYGCIVDLLGRAGHLKKAYSLVKLSPLKDKANIFCALLSACRTYGDAQLAQVISKDLLDLEPQNPGTYALISDIYAQGRLWNEAADLRIRAKERGLRKLPGYSFVESELLC